MTCREIADFLMEYLEGELPAGERRRFEAHLGECPDCVAYLESYRASIRLGHALGGRPDDAPPAGMPEEMVHAILTTRHGGR